MAGTVGVGCCEQCGWPALSGTRRCPYCRAPLPRPSMRRRAPSLLAFFVVAWAALCVAAVAAAYYVTGSLWALLLLVPAAGPSLALEVLRRRTLARVRSLGRRHTGTGRLGGGPTASPSDAPPSDRRR